ncbi:hypothetical protein NE691_11485 [Enterococcus faecalis]|uniref:hypothetical protein n=1 Tax=Enterococcus faecalis TaxID=1351 RepID=UPI00210E1CD1|nr:hypothetical protein [Enterococcus faecalis]MCQ4859150.1 hypothetical protein [Enterococcus faecalis]
MKLVRSYEVDVASYITTIKCDEYKFLLDNYPEAVLDKNSQLYLYLECDFFDKSDLAQLANEIKSGEIYRIDEVTLPQGYLCYYNQRTNEYIGVKLKNNLFG